MINTYCAICDADNNVVLYEGNFNLKEISGKTFSARRFPDKIHYRMVKCKTCGLVYANPRLSSSVIEKLYKKSSYKYKQYESDLIATYSKYFKESNSFLTSKERLLEIGCGNGFFLKYAKKIGFEEVWGVEPGKETVSKTEKEIQKYIKVDIFKENQFKKKYFDIICLFQVFDHIPDPNSLLSECHKILKKHGVILCINHNVESFSARLFKDKSPIIDIEHTYLFNKKTQSEIFQKNKYKVIKTFDVVNRYPLFYWLRLFPIPAIFKKKLIKFLSRTTIGRTKIWLPPGNIGIIAIKN